MKVLTGRRRAAPDVLVDHRGVIYMSEANSGMIYMSEANSGVYILSHQRH